MKSFLLLSVVVLAALAEPGLQPAQPICLGLRSVTPLLPIPDGAWLDSLYGPPDTVYGDTLVDFGAMLHSQEPYPFANVRIDLWDNGRQVWSDIRIYDVAAGDSALVDWRFSTAGESGYYMVRDMFIDFQGNPPWDTWLVTWRFWVVPVGGAAEGSEQQAAGLSLRPTVVSRLDAGIVAFDAMGRRVLNPKHGIYFIRTEAAAVPRRVLLVE